MVQLLLQKSIQKALYFKRKTFRRKISEDQRHLYSNKTRKDNKDNILKSSEISKPSKDFTAYKIQNTQKNYNNKYYLQLKYYTKYSITKRPNLSQKLLQKHTF